MNAGNKFIIDAGAAFFNLAAPTLPATLYCALFTDSVTAAGVGTEVADPAANSIGYVRKALPATAFGFSNPFYFLNTNLVFDPAAGGDWGDVVSVCFTGEITAAMDATNVIWFGNLDASITVDDIDTFQLLAGIFFILSLT